MKTRKSRPSLLLVSALVGLGASALVAFTGCAQIVGITDLDGGEGGSSGGGSGSGSGGGSGSGSSSGSSNGSGSGSSSGGPSAFVGTWTASGTQTSSCGASTPESGSQSITAGPGAEQITLPIFSGQCTIVFNVAGTTATLVPGQGCSGTATTTGDTLVYDWNTGSLTLDSASHITAALGFTETNETLNESCSFTLSETFTQ